MTYWNCLYATWLTKKKKKRCCYEQKILAFSTCYFPIWTFYACFFPFLFSPPAVFNEYRHCFTRFMLMNNCLKGCSTNSWCSSIDSLKSRKLHFKYNADIYLQQFKQIHFCKILPLATLIWKVIHVYIYMLKSHVYLLWSQWDYLCVYILWWFEALKHRRAFDF